MFIPAQRSILLGFGAKSLFLQLLEPLWSVISHILLPRPWLALVELSLYFHGFNAIDWAGIALALEKSWSTRAGEP
jgi:hypothetical protein